MAISIITIDLEKIYLIPIDNKSIEMSNVQLVYAPRSRQVLRLLQPTLLFLTAAKFVNVNLN